MIYPLRYNSNVTDVIDEHSVQIDVIVGEISSNNNNNNNIFDLYSALYIK